MSRHQALGEAIACVHLGIKPETYVIQKAAGKALDSVFPSSLDRMVVEFAKAAFYEGEGKVAAEFHLYDALSKEANWAPELKIFVDPIYTAINTVCKESFDEEMSKAAMGGFMVDPVHLIGGAADMAPGMLKLLYGTAILGGGLAGGGAWLANRHASQDEEDIEHMKAKKKLYTNMTSQIRNELARKGVSADSPEGVAAIQGVANNTQ